MKKKILIAGDSFAADWTKKYKNISGWVNMLQSDFNVTNIAEAGVSEYKIYKQLKGIDVSKFDNIIISHTSAYRIPIEQHPIHRDDSLHSNCDIIYSDAKEYNHPIMKTAVDFYENIFHTEYFCFVNELVYREIYNLFPNAIHITFFDNFYPKNVLKFENVFLENRGNINHMNIIGNKIIYDKIKNIIDEKKVILE